MRLDIRNPEQVKLARNARPHLDGAFLSHCVMADEEAGIVEVWITDENGRVKAFWDDDGQPGPRTEQRTGVVKIEFS